MPRKGGEKIKCDGTMTQGAFNTFVRNVLRQGFLKWKTQSIARKKSSVRRGFFQCASCEKIVKTIVREGGKRVKNQHIDHIDPVTPLSGFTTWDEFIDRLFCDSSNLQALCVKCHKEKSAWEAGERKRLRDEAKGL